MFPSLPCSQIPSYPSFSPSLPSSLSLSPFLLLSLLSFLPVRVLRWETNWQVQEAPLFIESLWSLDQKTEEL